MGARRIYVGRQAAGAAKLGPIGLECRWIGNAARLAQPVTTLINIVTIY